MLSRPQMNRVKRLFLYPSHTSLKITASSGLPTGWHVLSPLFSVSKWSGKNLLWKSLSLVQTVFTELCQGVMKWAIISLHQRVRFHEVHALVNSLLPLKQGSEPPLSLLGRGLHLMPALLFLWQFNEPIQLSQLTENGSFSRFSIACEMNQLTQKGQRSRHAVMNQDRAWVGMHPDGKEGEEVLSVQ